MKLTMSTTRARRTCRVNRLGSPNRGAAGVRRRRVSGHSPAGDRPDAGEPHVHGARQPVAGTREACGEENHEEATARPMREGRLQSRDGA